VGEAFAEGTRVLARRAERDVEYFNGGEPTADVRLEMRGILVGVSFESADAEPTKDDEGGSLLSCVLFAAVFPTEGDPAMVGNWLRLRREESDCFCIELPVCNVTLEEDIEARLDNDVVAVAAEVDFSFATRWAVIGSRAEICMGGRLTGDLGFLGSVEDKVWK